MPVSEPGCIANIGRYRVGLQNSDVALPGLRARSRAIVRYYRCTEKPRRLFEHMQTRGRAGGRRAGS